MKTITQLCKYLFVTSFILMSCVSCGDDEPSLDDDKTPGSDNKPNNKIEYYVKYQSNVSIPVSKHVPVYVTVVTEKGAQELEVPRSWEGVYGPFNVLTTMSISLHCGGNYNPNMTSCRGRISICRGNQPFVLKTDQSFKGTSFTVSYSVTQEDLK